jgi:hypothetical protein
MPGRVDAPAAIPRLHHDGRIADRRDEPVPRA